MRREVEIINIRLEEYIARLEEKIQMLPIAPR